MTDRSKHDHLKRLVTEKRFETIKRVLSQRQRDLTLVIENIHDPHNVGAIFRSADAVGMEEVHLLYTKETFPALHPKVTASGGKWVKQRAYDDPKKLVEDLKARDYTIYTTNLTADAVSIHDVDWTKPSAIVLGNENRGVSTQMTEYADKNIRIPMFGMVESLNVSVANAVILFEICRQRQEAGMYPRQDLEPEWLDEMTEKWVKINRTKQ